MSSRRAQRRQACEGKIAYASIDQALAAVRGIWRRHQRALHAYRCTFCGAFHLGHMPKRIRQAVRERRAAYARA